MNAMHRHYFALERERGYVADVSDVIIDSYASCICPSFTPFVFVLLKASICEGEWG